MTSSAASFTMIGGIAALITRAKAWLALAIVGTAAAVTASCLDVGAFTCERDDQCALGDRTGSCSDGHCAFPDPECDSGWRWHGSAASDLAGVCVPVPSGSSDGSSSGAGSSSGPEPPSSTSDGTPGSDTLAVDPSSTTGEASCGDLPCACAVALAAADGSTCALRDDERVVCWGENDDEQLGVIGKVNVSPWPLVAAIPARSPVTRVVAGSDHYCAQTRDGGAWCWGRNVEGHVSPELMPTDVAPPIPITWLDGVTQLGLATNLTCASAGDLTTVTCWGNNEFGELGVIEETPTAGPFVIGAPLGDLPIDEIAAGRDHACVRTGGDVLCWGANANGQLGDAGLVDPDPVPAPVVLPAAAMRLVAGRRHNCVVLEPGDTVMCWGHNTLGQVGANTTSSKHTTPIALVMPTDFEGTIVDIRANLDGTCLLTDAGTLLCWGSNGGNKLQIGAAMEFTALPVVVDIPDELPAATVEIAVGDAHICVRTVENRVYCWGADNEEQLGPVDPQPGMKSVEIDLECLPR